jgi:hypothetical protein
VLCECINQVVDVGKAGCHGLQANAAHSCTSTACKVSALIKDAMMGLLAALMLLLLLLQYGAVVHEAGISPPTALPLVLLLETGAGKVHIDGCVMCWRVCVSGTVLYPADCYQKRHQSGTA